MSEITERTDPDKLRDYWREHVDAYAASGESGAAYCKRHNLLYHRFVYWRQKFRPAAPDEPSKFARVVGLAPGPAHELSVTLPNGLVIGGIGEHNVGLVRQLLESL